MGAPPLTPPVVRVPCCIVGGGPAGVVLGFLLARVGVPVLVLERHDDFLRDFRGDTMHPSTLGLLHELGLLEDLLRIPHHRVERMTVWIDDDVVTLADFTRLRGPCRFATMLPQWDFLDFLVGKASAYPGFSLRMGADVTGLVREEGRVVGVRAATADGPLEVRADVVIGCDGRSSVVREAAGLPVTSLGAPADVLWFRLPRRPGDPDEVSLRIQAGRFVVLLGRPEHWQCGFVVSKGGAEAWRGQDVSSLQAAVAEAAPFLADRVDALRSWADVPVLSVRVDRLTRWYRPGLLCIGDAAHAMSPMGGVGVNLAIQDAVATARLLAPALRAGRGPSVAELRRVQRRRSWPARGTQRVQVLLGERLQRPILEGGRNPARPAAGLLRRLPFLPHLIGRFIGIGLRPEHVGSGPCP